MTTLERLEKAVDRRFGLVMAGIYLGSALISASVIGVGIAYFLPDTQPAAAKNLAVPTSEQRLIVVQQ